MNMNPSVSGMIAHERQRDMLAEASRRRLVREARAATSAARRAERVRQRTGGLFRRAHPVISPS